MQYLRNTWYVAAWAGEVLDRPVGRVMLEEKIVLWRDAQGTAHALEDRCPHRFVPLSIGRVRGHRLHCGYHGLGFDATGQCVHNPHGNGEIPKAAHVRRYPVEERWSALWIWMGAPERADPTLIPDFSNLDPERFFVGTGYLQVEANYQLEVDNILDLSHIDYVHEGSLGGGNDVDAVCEVVQEGTTVHSRRLTRGERLPPALEARHGHAPGTRVDRWLDVRWEAPGNMELLVGHALAGLDDPRAGGKGMCFAHFMSPMNASTTHYWYAVSRPRSMGPHAQQMAEEETAFVGRPFEQEDLPVLKAQQQAMGDAEFWSCKPVLLATDAAAVRARRVLDGLIAAEQENVR